MKKHLLTILIFCISFPLIGQPFGNAINFDGIDDYCIVPHHASLNPGNGSWTVALWIKAADEDQVSPFVMKRLTNEPYTQYAYGFAMDDPHNPQPGKRIRVNHIANSGLSERSGYTALEFIDGNWHHFAIVADKDENGIVVFVDGVAVDFIQLFYYGLWPDVNNFSDLIIARRGPNQNLKGPMDELSIWQRALKQNQIRQIMHDTLSPAYYASADSGLVAYYRFEVFEDLGINGVGANDLRDLSVWHNHAAAEGNPELISSGIPVGIDKPDENPGLLIFPNPATDHVSIRVPRFNTQPAKISMYSSTSVKIKELILPIGNEGITLGISNLPPGIYIVRLHNEKMVEVGKLIIN